MGRLLGFDEGEVAQRPNGVYCVKSVEHGFWKVGRTADISKRLISLDESAPFKIEGVFFIPWAHESHQDPDGTPVGPMEEAYLEAWILRALSEWRSYREWFVVTPERLPDFATSMLWAIEGWGPVVRAPAFSTLLQHRRFK